MTGVRTEHFANDAECGLTVSTSQVAGGIEREATLALADTGAFGMGFADRDEGGVRDSAE